MKARYDGYCREAGDAIVPGDDIRRDGRGWSHVRHEAPGGARGWWGEGEYPMADAVYDARGGAASDYEWYGDDADYGR